MRSKNAFVPAVVLELTVDELGNDIARVQHSLMLGGIIEVKTERSREFRPSSKPLELTHQLLECWKRYKAAEAEAEREQSPDSEDDHDHEQEQEQEQEQKNVAEVRRRKRIRDGKRRARN